MQRIPTAPPSEPSELARCRAVFLPSDPARAGLMAFWRPDGELLPAVAQGAVSELDLVLPAPGRTIQRVQLPALLVPVRTALPLLACARAEPESHRATAFWGAAGLLCRRRPGAVPCGAPGARRVRGGGRRGRGRAVGRPESRARGVRPTRAWGRAAPGGPGVAAADASTVRGRARRRGPRRRRDRRSTGRGRPGAGRGRRRRQRGGWHGCGSTSRIRKRRHRWVSRRRSPPPCATMSCEGSAGRPGRRPSGWAAAWPTTWGSARRSP